MRLFSRRRAVTLVATVPKEEFSRGYSELSELVGRSVLRAFEPHFHATTASVRDDSIPLAL